MSKIKVFCFGFVFAFVSCVRCAMRCEAVCACEVEGFLWLGFRTAKDPPSMRVRGPPGFSVRRRGDSWNAVPEAWQAWYFEASSPAPGWLRLTTLSARWEMGDK